MTTIEKSLLFLLLGALAFSNYEAQRDIDLILTDIGRTNQLIKHFMASK